MPAPNVPSDIMDRIADLENQVRELAGRVAIRPALSEIKGGGVTISQGGTLAVVTPGNQQALYIGAIGPNHPDGTPQYGSVLRREDGSVALAVWDAAGNTPQPLNIWDRAGNVVFADDRVTGQGLARPYISTDAWIGATTAPTDTTSSASFTTLQNLFWYKQHPRVLGYYLVQTSTGTTGEIRMVDGSGAVVIAPQPIAANQFYYGSAIGSVPGGHEVATDLHWQARVTGGAGTIGVRGLSTFGIQS